MNYNKNINMYECDYKAFFKTNFFNANIITNAVNSSVTIFNLTKRKYYKNIQVSVNNINNCLDIHYVSEINQNRQNWLRSIQLFSKLLVQATGMSSYIVGKSLLYS